MAQVDTTKRKAPPSLLDGITKLAAVLGALIAVGQAASTWIDGVYKNRAEREKSDREIKLADIKERSALAESYLKLILSKETPIDGRAILFEALGQLDGHPLQKWAQKRHNEYLQYNVELADAYRAQTEAAQHRDEVNGVINALKADISALNVQIRQNMDNPAKAAELNQQRVAKSAELAKASAAHSVAIARIEAATATIGRSARADPTTLPPEPNLASAIQSLASRLDVPLLMSLFPGQAAKDIEVSVPYLQAALQEFKISDPRLAATIIATIAVETPSFAPYEEPVAAAARYERRADLGNTTAGDGVKYRGRGYIGLTGRANYRKMSERLGLGSRLEDSPDDAKSPEVASRILVAWFADRQDSVLAALDRDDFATVRRMVAGGAVRVDEFANAYRKAMDRLVDRRPRPAKSVPQR